MATLTNGELDSTDVAAPNLQDQDSKSQPKPSSPGPRSRAGSSADDPQTLVISSLRSQISDLFSQVNQLNGKLVKSYDRVSDLEDNLHIASSKLRSSSLKISQLELERTQHLAALNTGLLVEKDHVTAELNRLMEKATEEAARRGQAESAQADIEKDLDDLSATLFDQANTMVAEARFKRALSERKVEEAESALKIAEEAVGSMQLQMQQLREEKEQSDTEMLRLRATMGKGKWVEQTPTSSVFLRLLSLHTPYQEFLLFVAHLRSIHPSSPHPPAMSGLLPLPFLARLLAEDSDPTVRLDFAPSLNWLSRRSVLTAIYSGQLTIEPVSSTTLLLESSVSSLSSPVASSTHSNLSCALCGAAIFPSSNNDSAPPTHPSRNSLTQMSNSWSSSLFKNPLTNSANPSPPLTPPLSHAHVPSTLPTHPQQVHVFRVAHVPSPLPQQAQQRPTSYPLCHSGWCLARLRTTCSLWAFVRVGVVDKVWEEEVPVIHAPVPQKDKAPPLPPRRRSKITGMSMGSLWGMASGALSKEKILSKGDTASEKDLPHPPPSHPDLLPPATIKTKPALNTAAPPPLPRRSVERAYLRSSSPVVTNGPSKLNAVGEDSSLKKEHSSAAAEGKPALHVPLPPAGDADGAASPKSDNPTVTAPSLASESASTSRDEFVTPESVLAPLPAETAPVAAAAVPLPDSAPGTPVAGTFTHAAQPAHVAPAVQSVRNEELEKVPSRAGSPAPPPLPRRAARRPAPALPHPQGQDGSQAPAASAPIEATHPATVEVPSAVPAPDQLEKETAVVPDGGGVADEAAKVPVEPAKVETSGAAVEQPVPSNDAEKDDGREKSTTTAAAPEVESATTGQSAPSEVVKADNASTGEASPHEGRFIGEATWEERTWKEVVRLRENMFWARIGALR